METKKLLGIPIKKLSKKNILEEIKKFLPQPLGFFHIVSLNPENLVIAQENKKFKEVLETAQIKIIDGVGIVLAGKILGVPIGDRTSGVEFMIDLLKIANEGRLRVVLIGGGLKIAKGVVECQKSKFAQVNFFALQGIKNIKHPQKQEEEKIFSIVSRFKPHLIFAAFGSPAQELWLYKNREKFKDVVCMGIGQGFNVLSGKVKRAPVPLRKIGLEWLYRLVTQPWRWRRQLRLVKFSWLVIKERFKKRQFSNQLTVVS